jgi:hypothetical protein
MQSEIWRSKNVYIRSLKMMRDPFTSQYDTTSLIQHKIMQVSGYTITLVPIWFTLVSSWVWAQKEVLQDKRDFYKDRVCAQPKNVSRFCGCAVLSWITDVLSRWNHTLQMLTLLAQKNLAFLPQSKWSWSCEALIMQNTEKSDPTMTTNGSLCNRWFMYECVFIANATVLVYALECFVVAGMFLHAFDGFNE